MTRLALQATDTKLILYNNLGAIMRKKYMVLCFFLGLLSINSPVFAEATETTTEETAVHEQHHFDWSGVYHGFLPCNDCKGIKMTLALNPNNDSYILISQYIGKSDREIVEKGKFAWGDTDKTVVLTPRNSTQTRSYLVGENKLTQLDNNGNLVAGESAERYVLRRAELKQPQSQASHH
jgi:uncharacterized lipoprotein NlpE involved in copper resistance